ncbi:hypothetical protein [Pseudarthrobacter oxydans]|uniref:Uncharacterized protein (TIGR03382 family) n=1 Tax=Pseudarthrobacter oxydans TaxID=1671 RepID=A0AAW8N9S5_PSEOX|nr:hypothetical protein [Pseudarthrobacter oxydans]MDR6791981.1 uncharacterized protein (TIGR03382 family) [Pseudarthrobacter oxydans]MDR7163399.1 uncharacterized protein (TIGR03382 family) [Pseudarthrobacter oxydans]
MTARGWLVAVVGTVFLVFVLPYVLAVFNLAPNGMETLLLVVLLWAGSWVFARRRAPKSTDQ